IDPLWKALGIMGLVIALVQPTYRWLPIAFLVSLLPVAFLYNRGLLEPYRLSMHAFPFFVAASLLLLRSAATTLEKWRWRVRAPLGPKGQERG
ncbi:MAG: hypothetical protein ACE5G5_12865, partial [Candidatus Methylomirabilales bacterium]